jgi:AcrR family transcriptional regulator
VGAAVSRVSRKGIPKGDKRERTRAALIQAAADVIGEVGYERASLEAVAHRAGMSRGAIYGNFRSKDELLLAFVETRWRPVAPKLRPGAPLREQLRRIGEAVADTADARRAHAPGAFSFMLYATTHEPIRQQLAARNAEIYARMEAGLSAVLDPATLPLPPGEFVRVMHAMSDGFITARFMQPEVYTRELIAKAFEALAGPA